MTEERKEAYRYLLFGFSVVVAVPVALVALLAVVGSLWVFLVFNIKFHSCVQIGDDLFLGYAAVFDLSNPSLKPEVVMKTADGVPITETVYLAGRGPFAALSDENGYCSVRWDHDFGFHGGCPTSEGTVDEGFDAPFFKVTQQVFRSLRYPPVWCSTRYITW